MTHQLGEARPGWIEHLTLRQFQLLLQLAQLGHALDGLGLVVVAQGFLQILAQLAGPGPQPGADAAAELGQQFLDLFLHLLDVGPGGPA